MLALRLEVEGLRHHVWSRTAVTAFARAKAVTAVRYIARRTFGASVIVRLLCARPVKGLHLVLSQLHIK